MPQSRFQTLSLILTVQRAFSTIAKLSMMFAIVSSLSGATAVFVKEDATTKGSWAGVYGKDGQLIANDVTSPPSYAAVSVSGYSLWTWATSTTDTRDLLENASTATRIASCYYSGGQFNINVNITDGQSHQIGVYVLDWDTQGRSEVVTVLDGSTMAVLDARTISGFPGGEYLIYTVSGHIIINVGRTAGPNAVISGVFFDPAQSTPLPTGNQSFYIFAHEDDWALFMTPNAYNDASQAAEKVVFICTTAGDAGDGAGPSGVAHPYYLARQNGMLRAIMFIANLSSPGNGGMATPITGSVSVNGHSISRYQFLNTVTYFLNLPDGNVPGTGYPATGSQSLARLYTSAISTITAVDGSATYKGWSDLVATLKAIVQNEMAASTIQINYQNPNTTVNVGDHSDHIYSGLASQAVANAIPCLSQGLFLGYVTSTLPPNLGASDLTNKNGVFGNVVSGRSEWGWNGTWAESDLQYVLATYYTTISSSSPVCTK